MRVECGEVEFACDEKQDRSHGFEASVSARLALGGLKQSVDGFDEAVGLAALGPGDDAVEVSANQSHQSFIGSTFERMTLVHHCCNISETTLICLRSRISRSCSRYSQARAVRLVVY